MSVLKSSPLILIRTCDDCDTSGGGGGCGVNAEEAAVEPSAANNDDDDDDADDTDDADDDDEDDDDDGIARMASRRPLSMREPTGGGRFISSTRCLTSHTCCQT
jgi:hypothetical protein